MSVYRKGPPMVQSKCTFFTYSTAHGPITISSTERGICSITFDNAPGKGQRLATEATNRAATQIQEYFAGKRVLFDVPLDAGGTPFQREVWAEVCDIPYGQSCTAADVANSLGKSGSHRSIGTAIRRNPVPILIPTHRVDLPNATGRIAKIFRALRALEQSNTPD